MKLHHKKNVKSALNTKNFTVEQNYMKGALRRTGEGRKVENTTQLYD